MTEKPGFMLYHDDLAALQKLTDAQLGQLIRIMGAYSIGGEIPVIDDPYVDMAFSMLKHKLDYDGKRYEDVRKKRAEAGKQAHVGKSQQMPTNTANTNPNTNTSPNTSGNINIMEDADPRILALEKIKDRMGGNEE